MYEKWLYLYPNLAVPNMQPWKLLPVHPMLHQVIDSIVYLHVAHFSKLSVSPVFNYPWTAQVNMFFTLSEKAVLVRTNNAQVLDPSPKHFVLGPSLQLHQVHCPEQHHVIGLVIRPASFQRLFGIPVTELINRYIDVSFLGDPEMNALCRRLSDTDNTFLALRLIEAYFLRRIASCSIDRLPFDAAVNAIIRSNGNIRIDAVAGIACSSNRQLERKSLEQLGMSPKLFARLTRFARAYVMKETLPEQQWTSIAHQCGYYDQMHLLRDFRHFTGATPTQLELLMANTLTAMTALQVRQE